MEQQTNITVVDSMMGTGKTSYAISKIKNDNDGKYIYITPYLKEVDRIKENCKDKNFIAPTNRGKGKLNSFENLIINEKNIVATHSLFKGVTDEIKELIRINGYTLILDEVMDVVEQYPLKKDDMRLLLEQKLITIHEDGLITWNEDKMDFESKYDDIKLLCKNKSLFMVNNAILMWMFPVEIFKAFKEVYILTYLFNGQIQRYYYDLFNVSYTYKSVTKNDEYELCEYIKNQQSQYNVKSLINLLNENDKLNRIGDDKYALSKSWFEKNPLLTDVLRKNIGNYFKNRVEENKSKLNMWTTFKDYKLQTQDKNFSRNFVSLGLRATNEYIDKKNLAYCANIFLNPIVANFFYMHNVNVDEETYALSELLQWIWRSQIRRGDKINLFIPSLRMRNLLLSWLNNFGELNSLK